MTRRRKQSNDSAAPIAQIATLNKLEQIGTLEDKI